MTATKSIIRRATKKSQESYNIITFISNQDYEIKLSSTGHNFYYWTNNYDLEWNDKDNKPDNCIMLNKETQQLPSYIDFDIVLCPNRGMFQLCKQISDFMHLPVICLEHEYPDEEFKRLNSQQWRSLSSMDGDINVFSSESCRKGWQKMGYIAQENDDNFVDIWNNIFKEASTIIYTRM